jgi:tetratricopeptide (TPR) repeat protein
VDLKRYNEAIPELLHALTLSPRVMDGTPSVLLLQLYQRNGSTLESQFEAQWYRRMRSLKDTWPTLLKTMRQPYSASAADWKALGETALRRHENWIALCAFTRRVRLAKTDSNAWQELAMAQKRFGWFDEALDSMIRAHALSKKTL